MSERTRPSGHYAAVTPHDTTNLSQVNSDWPRGLYVGGAGNLVAVRFDDTAVTFTGVTAGTVLPISCKRVNSTNTTATSIVALY